MDLDFLRDESCFSVAIRDPVWKHVWLTPEFLDITRTDAFLRLYRIKQLGPTEFVYPGATHTRAAHSIGVYQVALKILRVLVSRGADQWITATGARSYLAAALLHDLGHFPFTHALKELPLESHESLTARLVRTEPLRTAVAAAGADPDQTASIIDSDCASGLLPDTETLFFRHLLSGVLDPDKLDYLNRDAYYCGVPYGMQDTDFILSRIQPDKDRGIVIDSRAILSIENILFSKYLMYRSVYWHRQVRMATAMMKKLLFAALEGGRLAPEVLYGLDDPGIYQLAAALPVPEKTLAEDILSRNFFRPIAEYPLDPADPQLSYIENLGKRTVLESEIAELLSRISGQTIIPLQVLIDLPERISFESDLFVTDEGRTFSKSTTVFSGDVVQRFTTSLRIIRIAVHPSAFPRLAVIPGIAEQLAKCIRVGYTLSN